MEDKINMRGFRMVFWGVFFILGTLYANGFDIFPDFIGYILICFGLKNAAKIPCYEKAQQLSLVLIFTSMICFYMSDMELPGGVMISVNALGAVTGSLLVSVVYNLVHKSIELAFFYFLCTGTSQMYEMVEDQNWAVLCRKIWIILSIGYIGNILTFFAAFWINGLLLMIVSCFAFIWIVGMISLLVMIFKARRKLDGTEVSQLGAEVEI